MNSSFRSRALAGQSTESGDGISYWDGEGVLGQPGIKINVENQRAYFYKGNQIVGVFSGLNWPRRLRHGSR